MSRRSAPGVLVPGADEVVMPRPNPSVELYLENFTSITRPGIGSKLHLDRCLGSIVVLHISSALEAAVRPVVFLQTEHPRDTAPRV